MGEVWPLSLLKGAVYNRDENCNSGHNDDVDGDEGDDESDDQYLWKRLKCGCRGLDLCAEDLAQAHTRPNYDQDDGNDCYDGDGDDQHDYDDQCAGIITPSMSAFKPQKKQTCISSIYLFHQQQGLLTQELSHWKDVAQARFPSPPPDPVSALSSPPYGRLKRYFNFGGGRGTILGFACENK